MTRRSAIYTGSVFLLGGILLSGGYLGARQDSWLSLLAAAAAAIPSALALERVCALYPGRGLFEITLILFGGVAGRVVNLALCLYSFGIIVETARYFGEVVKISVLPNTPMLVVCLVLLFLAAAAGRKELGVLGGMSGIFLFLSAIAAILSAALLWNTLDFSNILPLFDNPPENVLREGVWNFSNIFGEIIILPLLAAGLKKGEKPKRLFLFPVLIAASIGLVGLLRDLFALGAQNLSDYYFPYYISLSLVNIGGFLRHLEGLFVCVLMCCAAVRCALALRAAAEGLSAVCDRRASYRRLIFPVAVVAAGAAAWGFDSTMDFFRLTKSAAWYKLPVEIGVPLVLWLSASLFHVKQRLRPID